MKFNSFHVISFDFISFQSGQIQFHPIPSNSIPFHSIAFYFKFKFKLNSIQVKSIQFNAISTQSNSNAMRLNPIQVNSNHVNVKFNFNFKSTWQLVSDCDLFSWQYFWTARYATPSFHHFKFSSVLGKRVRLLRGSPMFLPGPILVCDISWYEIQQKVQYFI